MQQESQLRPTGLSEKFAVNVTKVTGSTPAFIIAFLVVLVWAISGPFFHYSENWQLIINTGTNIITFLMVFLIQKAQNKDSFAIQLKLNELVAAHEFASNRLVNVENMSEDEMKVIQKYYSSLSELTKKDESLQQSHSIDEAENSSEIKKEREEEIIERLNVNKKRP
jgi:low affinity Fe/Cu permease